MRRVVKILIGICAVMSWQVQAEEAKSPHPKAIMGGIFDQISFFLPLSFKASGFEAADPKEMSKRFQALLDLSSQLDQESKNYGDNFGNLAKSFKDDLTRSKWHYDHKNYAKSAFLMQNLTETCFACHSKYPSKPHAGNPDSFYQQINLKDFDEAEKTKIFVITRQFDKAQKTFETLLVDASKTSFEEIQYILENFVNVVMGNTRDFPALKRVLGVLQKRYSQDYQAAAILEAWVRDADKYASKKSLLAPTVENAKALVKEARSKTDYFYDKTGLITWAAATSVMNQVTMDKHTPEVDSELYYWLGVSASMFEHSLWVAQMPFFLEHAIRLNPAGEAALKAFTLLEKNTTYAYTGSSGTNIPPDELKKLSDLRQLIQNARKTK